MNVVIPCNRAITGRTPFGNRLQQLPYTLHRVTKFLAHVARKRNTLSGEHTGGEISIRVVVVDAEYEIHCLPGHLPAEHDFGGAMARDGRPLRQNPTAKGPQGPADGSRPGEMPAIAGAIRKIRNRAI